MARAVGAEHAADRQIEIGVVGRQPGHASGKHGDAVIGAHAADDLLLARTADRVVVEPDDLRRLVVRLRAGIGKQHLAEPLGNDLQQRLRQLDHRLGRTAVEDVIGRQLLHLADGRLDKPLLAETERRAPEASHALQILLAGVVVDVDALAPRDHGRTDRLVLLEVGVGVDDRRDITTCERIRVSGHLDILQGIGRHRARILEARILETRILGARILGARTQSCEVCNEPIALSHAIARLSPARICRLLNRRMDDHPACRPKRLISPTDGPFAVELAPRQRAHALLRAKWGVAPVSTRYPGPTMTVIEIDHAKTRAKAAAHGSSTPVVPQAVKGRIRRIKWAVLLLTLSIYYVTPFLRWDRGIGEPNQAHPARFRARTALRLLHRDLAAGTLFCHRAADPRRRPS